MQNVVQCYYWQRITKKLDIVENGDNEFLYIKL